MKDPVYEYDVFISHAVEDKLAIANELWARLEKAGLKVWYSGQELQVGDIVSSTILDGLAKSRFGIVILSPTYISKLWTLHEFFVLLTRQRGGQKMMLPVLHDITVQELAVKNLIMADMLAVDSSKGIDYVVEVLLREINAEREREKIGETARKKATLTARRNFILVAVACVLALLSAAYLLTKGLSNAPDDVAIESAIRKQVNMLEQVVEQEQRETFMANGAHPATMTEIDAVYQTFKQVKSYYRNEYFLYNGFRLVTGKKNVDAALGVNMESLTSSNQYGFSETSGMMLRGTGRDSLVLRYMVANESPIDFETRHVYELPDGSYLVEVAFDENIRAVVVTLTFPESQAERKLKRHTVRLIGFKPVEHFILTRLGNEWTFMLSEMPGTKK